MAEETQQGQEEEAIDPIALFTEKVREPVQGLAYLGHLTETFEYAGHSFSIRTLRPYDKLAIGLVLQPYRNTMMEVDAFQAAHVGMALTAIDGDEDFAPAAGPEIADHARARLDYVSRRWYQRTVEYIWGRYVLLEALAGKAISELDRLSQRGQPNNLPAWLDSLIEREHSGDETASDTPRSVDSNSDS